MAGLGDLRQALIDQVDWDPAPSADGVRRLNSYLDRATQQLALEAPFVFHEESVRFRTQTNVEPTLATDTISVMTDTTPSTTPVNPWTFTTNLDRSTTSVAAWKPDRTWDGRWIDVLDATTEAVLHRTQIQSVSWYNDGSNDLVKIVVKTPIDTERHGTGPFTWRVYTPVYWLQDDIVDVKNIRIIDNTQRSPIMVISPKDAEDLAFDSTDNINSPGLPSYAWEAGHFQLKGPNTSVLAELASDTSGQRWIGPEPPGKFSYIITYTWGKRDSEYQNAGAGYWAGSMTRWQNLGSGSSNSPDEYSRDRAKEPLWESPPSPISAEVTVSPPGTPSTTVPGVKLTFPNINYQLGHFMVGTETAATAFNRANSGLSGWHIRIYRRRHTEDFTNYTGFGNNQAGQSIDVLSRLDIDDAYYLLAEHNAGDVNSTNIFDTGEILPDYRRRLRDVHGYRGVMLHPMPDAEYDMEVRCVRRPPRLVSDQDAPKIHAEARDLIIYKASTYAYEHMGQPGNAARSEAKYTDLLMTARKRYGDMRPADTPVYRRKARASRIRGTRLFNHIDESSSS